MMSIIADQKAFSKVSRCDPQWSGMCRVNEVLSDDRKLLLHAGPPFPSIDKVPVPVMNSLCIGAIYEGWAEDYIQAREKIFNGEIIAEPAQDHDIVVPLAGVVSPSMMLMIITDSHNPHARKYSVLNEGMVHCTRLGKLDPALQNHLTWLNGPLSEWLSKRLVQPINLLPIISAALALGDDCHGRTIAGSALVVEQLVHASGDEILEEIEVFLQASPAFSLNIWMAASSLMLAAAEGVENSSLITRAGGNGYEFGVQFASKPGRWITMLAPQVKGDIELAHAARTAVGAIGDSAVVDFMGLGGQVLNTATASYDNLRAYLPADALTRPDKALVGPIEGFGGRRGVTSARQVVGNEGGPMVLLGMIDDRGDVGRIGGGVVDVPVAFFHSAMREVGL